MQSGKENFMSIERQSILGLGVTHIDTRYITRDCITRYQTLYRRFVTHAFLVYQLFLNSV